MTSVAAEGEKDDEAEEPEPEDCEVAGFRCSKNESLVEYCEEAGKPPVTVYDCSQEETNKYCGRAEGGLYECQKEQGNGKANTVKCPSASRENVPDIFTCKGFWRCLEGKRVGCGANEFVLPQKGSPCMKLKDCPFNKVVECEPKGKMQILKYKDGKSSAYCYMCLGKKEAMVFPCPR